MKSLLTILAILSAAFVPGVSEAGSGSPKYRVTSVLAESEDAYTVWFHSGSEARVTVRGDGDTDLDLYVFDEHGNLVACDDDCTDYCVVRFTPAWTGRFKIVVKNLGGVYNRYRIDTN
jgi:hypothetical protein